jgi:hypothetical protein
LGVKVCICSEDIVKERVAVNTFHIALMILISTAISMGAGIFACQHDWAWCWAMLSINFFLLFFGVLMPFRYHYQRSYYRRAYRD